MMKKILCLLLIVFTASTRGQGIPDAFTERVYLQTDKQLYLAGELVYLKVFTVTPGKKPLSFSKVVYVELLDETNAKVQVMIGLTNGIGDGWMELPLDLPTGHYRMIAYTQFMRNETESVFFEKNIGIVNTFQPNQIKKEFHSTPKSPKGDFRTAPEDISSPLGVRGENITCSLHPDKPLYVHREKGVLKLEGLPDNIHTLSVSIAGQAPIAIDGVNDIRQWEKQVPAMSALSQKYLPEYEGHIVTGKVVPVQTPLNTDGEILIPLLSYPGEKLYLFEGQKDELNNVSFYTTNTSGIKEMSTTAYNLSENTFRIDLQSPFIEQHTRKQLPVLQVDSSHFDGLLERSVALQALYSYTKDQLMQDRPSDFRFDMKPAQTYILDEYTRFVVMNELMIEFIRELRFRRNDRRKQELMIVTRKGDYVVWARPLVVLDGMPIMDHEIIYQYNPLLVERVNVYTGEYIYGGMKFDGIAEFLTYGRNYPTLSTNQSTQIVNYAGTQAPRRLYTPNYPDENSRQSRLPDYRHTLLWEPMLQSNGKTTVEIPFYTSDFTGEFLVTVEGVTRDGEVVSTTATFEVKASPSALSKGEGARAH